MSTRATCQLCGERFDRKRDERKWKITGTPLGAVHVGRSPAKLLIVCTDCFLEIAEPEYGV